MSTPRKIEVLWEHTSWGWVWRGVIGGDGGGRVERRGLRAKTWSVVCWCSADYMADYREDGALMHANFRAREALKKLRGEIARCPGGVRVERRAPAAPAVIHDECCRDLKDELKRSYDRYLGPLAVPAPPLLAERAAARAAARPADWQKPKEEAAVL
jgi:hypothetical protein